VGPQGIFWPAILAEMPLSITTVAVIDGRERPYEDEMGPDGLLQYRYRGTDPAHRDNVGLRLALQRRVPLVYLGAHSGQN
jgi:putative restriction endonuclease